MNRPDRQHEHNAVCALAEELAARTPHTFTIQYPPSRSYFQQRFQGAIDEDILTRHDRLLLYVHVPFCEQRCFYCNFAVDLRKSHATHVRYTRALCTQLTRLHERVPEHVTLPGIDIGGGTPTRLEADELDAIFAALEPWRARLEEGAHISIETTPSIAANHPGRLQSLRRGGVQRISMGVQSTDAETLAMVNRRRQRQMTERALENIAATGFDRVNVDLVFGLPGQRAEHLLEDLTRVVSLGVDSVTTYDCLYRGQGRILTELALASDWPTPEQYGEMYDAAYRFLTERGFHAQYGGVNFSRHADETGTSSYFEGRLLDGLPYLGAGNYASSTIDDAWFFAPYEVDDYVEAIEAGASLPVQDAYRLPIEERAAKLVLANLNYGLLDPARFEAAMGVDFEDLFGDRVRFALERGWISPTTSSRCWSVAPGHFKDIYALRALFYPHEALSWVKLNLDAIWSSHLESATV